MSEIQFILAQPPVDQFIALREKQGWGRLDIASAKHALEHSVLCGCLYQGDHLVGMGRVIGDGRLNFLLLDIIIAEPYRGKGYGHDLVGHLLDAIKNHIRQNFPKLPDHSEAYIALMSANGKEAFYHKHGFVSRPNDDFGAGMSLTLPL